VLSKTTCEIDDKNQIEDPFISSQSFHWTPAERIQEITVKERFKPQIIESFDPVTQELYRHLTAAIHTQELKEKIKTWKHKFECQRTDALLSEQQELLDRSNWLKQALGLQNERD
jgi:hypothetical protein